jgi:hypothetical protein
MAVRQTGILPVSFPRSTGGVCVSAKGVGSCKPAAAGKSFPKRALNLLGSKADSVELKAKKPGSLLDY